MRVRDLDKATLGFVKLEQVNLGEDNQDQRARFRANPKLKVSKILKICNEMKTCSVCRVNLIAEIKLYLSRICCFKPGTAISLVHDSRAHVRGN